MMILLLLVLYVFTNALFVWKYAPEYVSRPGLALAVYVAGIIIVLWALFKSESITDKFRVSGAGYFTFVCISAILLDILMLQFDPARIAVGRYPAINEWLGRLFNGEFPYSGMSGANPSGFPFLYVLFMPFYFLGDPGLMQIACYIIFASVLYDWHERKGGDALSSLVLLLVSPAFLYEVVVRSELFSNMVVIILYLHLLGKIQWQESRAQAPSTAALPTGRGTVRNSICGLIGGFLLSTRGIVLPIYLVYFAYMFKKGHLKSPIFYIMVAAGFVATFLPFIIWDAGRFLMSGPFGIQVSYIPPWLVGLAIVLSIVYGLRASSLNRVYGTISLILFGVILVPFVIAVASLGFAGAVRGDRFDISYFCFVLPFVILAFTRKATQDKIAVA